MRGGFRRTSSAASPPYPPHNATPPNSAPHSAARCPPRSSRCPLTPLRSSVPLSRPAAPPARCPPALLRPAAPSRCPLTPLTGGWWVPRWPKPTHQPPVTA